MKKLYFIWQCIKLAWQEEKMMQVDPRIAPRMFTHLKWHCRDNDGLYQWALDLEARYKRRHQ